MLRRHLQIYSCKTMFSMNGAHSNSTRSSEKMSLRMENSKDFSNSLPSFPKDLQSQKDLVFIAIQI